MAEGNTAKLCVTHRYSDTKDPIKSIGDNGSVTTSGYYYNSESTNGAAGNRQYIKDTKHVEDIDGYELDYVTVDPVIFTSNKTHYTTVYYKKKATTTFAKLRINCYDYASGASLGYISQSLVVGEKYDIKDIAPDKSDDDYELKSVEPKSVTLPEDGYTAQAYYTYVGTTDISFTLTKTDNKIHVNINKIDKKAPYLEVYYYETDNPNNDGTIAYKKYNVTSVTLSISGCKYNTEYTVQVRYSPDGEYETLTDTKTIYIPPLISDDDLVDGCEAYWYNYANGNSGKWGEHTVIVCLKMGEYGFNADYFTEAGLIWRDYFTSGQSSLTTKQVKDTAIPTTIITSKSVILEYTDSSLSPMSLANYMVYLKTINGTYMPIPAATTSSSNDYQFAAGIMPKTVNFTDGYIPKQDEEVKLKASDIVTFVKTMNYMYRWFYGSDSCGVDLSMISSGSPIYAATYSGLYDALNSIKSLKSFTMPYANTYLQKGKSIRAEDMLNLCASINNLIGDLT